MRDRALNESIASLLSQSGLAAADLRLRSCAAGGNNRVYFVEGAAVPIVAKSYFRSETDTRNRLHAEWSFINYAYSSAIRCVPRPIAADPAAQLALYERVDGLKMAAADIGETEVRAAADFVRALNDPARRKDAEGLPPASEAGFSIAEHFAVIDRRLERLVLAAAPGDTDAATRDFVADLGAAWQALKNSVSQQAGRAGLAMDEVLPAESRWISP